MQSTMDFLPAVVALLLVGAPEGSDFEQAWTKARPVPSLRRFLEEVVGDCDASSDPRFDRRGCLETAARRRRALEGQSLAIELRELQGKLTAPEWDERRGRYRLLWTPIAGEAGLGLSVGRPERLDRAGRPVVRRIPLWVERPSGMPEFIFLRDLERGMVALDVIVTIGESWRLGPRGERSTRGLSVELRGWRLRTRRAELGAALLGP